MHWLLLAIKTQETTDLVEHGMPFVVCLFPVVNGALFVQKIRVLDRVGIMPWQKLFLPGHWKKLVKTVEKTGKNSRVCTSFHHFNITFITVVAPFLASFCQDGFSMESQITCQPWLRISVRVKVSCCSGVLTTSFKDVIDFNTNSSQQVDTPMH